MQKKYGVAFLSLILMSCSRPQQPSSKIVFQLPTTQTVSSKITTLSYAAPADIDDIDCFYVAAGGPEPAMSNLQCGKKNGAGAFESMISAGFIFGGVSRSSVTQSIEFEVPSGENRSFYLLGMKTGDGINCIDFSRKRSFFENSNQMSREVYLLAVSKDNTLVAGGTQTVGMDINFDSEKWLKECAGSSIVEPAPVANLPTHLFLSKSTFPENAHVYENQCEPFEFQLRNSMGRPTAASANISVHTLIKTRSNTFDSLESYSSQSDCSAQILNTSSDSFMISAGTKEVIRWVKIPSLSVNLSDDFIIKFYVNSSAIQPAHFVKNNPVAASIKIHSVSESGYRYSILGPRLVEKGKCYAFHVREKNITGSNIGSMDSYKVLGQMRNGNKIFSIYSDSSCTSEVVTSNPVNLSTFYARFLIREGEDPIDFSLLGSRSGTSDLVKGSFLQVQSLPSAPISGLSVVGPRVISHSGGCAGPYYVQYKNIEGAAVPSEVDVMDVSNHLMSFSSGGAPIAFFSASNCSPGSVFSSAPILGNDPVEFYVDTSGVTAFGEKNPVVQTGTVSTPANEFSEVFPLFIF